MQSQEWFAVFIFIIAFVWGAIMGYTYGTATSASNLANGGTFKSAQVDVENIHPATIDPRNL